MITESRPTKEEEKNQYAGHRDEQKSGQYSYAVSGFWPGVNTIKLLKSLLLMILDKIRSFLGNSIVSE